MLAGVGGKKMDLYLKLKIATALSETRAVKKPILV